jgi:hypothetical protein
MKAQGNGWLPYTRQTGEMRGGAVEELNDLASPMLAFIRDWARQDDALEVTVPDFYEAWCYWCKEQGRQPGNAAMFGRDLRAASPRVAVSQRTLDDAPGRKRVYRGIGLTEVAKMTVSQQKALSARDNTRVLPLHT